MQVLIDGVAYDPKEAAISVFDHGLLRGDGCFEALRSYDGTPFKLDEHLDRLQNSARLLGIVVPPRDLMASWIADIAADGGDCTVRIVVTRGGVEAPVPSRVIVLAEPIPRLPDVYSVLPLPAPWHPDGGTSELTGAKTLSYAQNMAAGRAARQAGFDDALLIGGSGHVLEGPTFCIAWVVDSVLETPALDLGILASITRQAVLEEADHAGIEVREGHFDLSRVANADEVMALSTVKEVRSIGRVGEWHFTPGPVRRSLADRYRTLIASLSAVD
jgi:branched-subunit amino acid aminotransferase/4-amino-4-deoxychorismate lyase